MMHKTKAALQSCQCHYEKPKRIQHTRVNVGGQRMSQRNFEDADFIQLLWQSPKVRFAYNSLIPAFFLTLGKKGGISNPTVWLDTKAQIRALVYSGSDLAFLRCRRLISPFAAVIRNPAVLSPSSFSFSISSKSSRGSLTESCKERLFFLPVAITETSYIGWCSVYTRKLIIKHLKWCSPSYTLVVFTLSTAKAQVRHKTAKPRGALTPSGLLTKPLVEVTVMADQQHTQTHPEFTWRFLSTSERYPTAKPLVIYVNASSEQEARDTMPGVNLIFSARLPFHAFQMMEVNHA
ncbi:TPA: host cell division inhibitor Icd-like protein [Raoultella terrigena]